MLRNRMARDLTSVQYYKCRIYGWSLTAILPSVLPPRLPLRTAGKQVSMSVATLCGMRCDMRVQMCDVVCVTATLAPCASHLVSSALCVAYTV
jgi:hypothetical protein